MQAKETGKYYFGYYYDGKSIGTTATIKNRKNTANPIQRELLENLPNTGKNRKQNTHLKKSKKRK